MKKIGTWTLSLIMACTGCSLKRSLDDTQNTTHDMKTSTDQIKRDSDLLAARTDAMNAELTYDRAYFGMMQNFRWLWGQESGQSDEKTSDLLLYAGAATLGMWFQFWKGNFNDNVNSLDERFYVAAETLLMQVKGHSPFNHPVELLLGPDRQYLACAALAAKMDYTRPEFKRALQTAGLKPFSMYDLFVMALRGRNTMERTEMFPKAVAKVLQFEENAEYLMQLRHNFLPMMVVASVTNFQDQNMFVQLLDTMTPTGTDLRKFVGEQFKEWTFWLQQAKQTREDLRAMGIAPVYNQKMLRIERNLDMGQRWILATPAERLTGVDRLRRDFVQAYVDLVNQP